MGGFSQTTTSQIHPGSFLIYLFYFFPFLLSCILSQIGNSKFFYFSFLDSFQLFLVINIPFQAHTVLEMNYTEQLLTAAVSHGLRPILASAESGAPKTLIKLIEKCWSPNPLDRPSFDDILEDLESLSINDKRNREVAEDDKFVNWHKHYQEELSWSSLGEQFSKTEQLGNSNFNSWRKSINGVHAYMPTISSGSFGTCGRREKMEDTHFMLPMMSGSNDIHMFGIFDGHRGGCLV